MKTIRKIYVIILLTAFTQLSYGQVKINWQQCYGGEEEDELNSFIKVQDGFILVGHSSSSDTVVYCEMPPTNQGYQRDWLIKIDTLGNLLWERCIDYNFGSSSIEKVQGHSGDFYIFGSGRKQFGASWRASVIRYDKEGNKKWDRTYGSECVLYSDGQIFGISTADGGSLLMSHPPEASGNVSEVFFPSYDSWVIKLDSLGRKQWEKTYGSTRGITMASNLFQTSDKGYLLTGRAVIKGAGGGNIDCYTYNYNLESDAIVIKTDSLGNIEWYRNYGGDGDDGISQPGGRILEEEDGYLLFGTTNSSNHDLTDAGCHDYYYYSDPPDPYSACDAWLLKIDFKGNVLRSKCYGGTKRDMFTRIFSTGDGGYMCIGHTLSNDGDVSGNPSEGAIPLMHSSIWIVRLDADFDIMWQRCIGSSRYEDASAGVIQYDSRNYTIGGIMGAIAPHDHDVSCSNWFWPSGKNYYICDITDTVSYDGLPELHKIAGFNLFPNPATHQFTIQCPEKKQYAFTLQNLAGKIVKQIPQVTHGTAIDVQNIPEGMYIAILTDEKNNKLQAKVIVLRR